MDKGIGVLDDYRFAQKLGRNIVSYVNHEK